jgi:hypothetical protein
MTLAEAIEQYYGLTVTVAVCCTADNHYQLMICGDHDSQNSYVVQAMTDAIPRWYPSPCTFKQLVLDDHTGRLTVEFDLGTVFDLLEHTV